MTPQTIVFNDITPQKWQGIRRAFAAQGVSADFKRYGDTLSVVVTDKPWLVTVDFVVRKLTDFINEA